MNQSEPPRRQDPYLSTEDIIQRVRVTQGRAQPWQVFRGPLAVIGALAVVLCLLLLLHRAREHEHQQEVLAAQAKAAQAERQAEDEGGAGEAPPAADAPQADDSAAPAESPSAAAVEAASAPPTETRMPLTIVVTGRPGIIALDGHRLTVDRRWSGKVTPGRHQLSVRCGSVTLRRRVEITREPVRVSFDCTGRRPAP